MTTRKKDNKGLVILAILALLLLLAGKKKAPAPGGGAALPGGTVGSVDVTQGYYAARAHLVVKHVGDTVFTTGSWTASTKDFSGQPIAWNYGMSWRYRSAVTGDLRFGGFVILGNKPNGTFAYSLSNVLDAAFFPGNWDVQVALHADNSSPTGQPLGDMAFLRDNALLLANGDHLNAFKVI